MASGALTTITAVVCFGYWFLYNWIGVEYVSRDWTERSDVVLAILALAQVPRLILASSQSLIYATGDLRLLSKVYIGEAAAKIALSLLLVRPFGLAGVALGTLLPVTLLQLGFVPAHVSRYFGIPIWDWARRCLLPAAAGAAVVAAMSLTLIAWRRPLDWATFFAETGAVGLLMVAAWYRFGLTAEQRGRIESRVRRALPGRTPG